MAQNIGFVVAIVLVFALGIGLSRRVMSKLTALHVRLLMIENLIVKRIRR